MRIFCFLLVIITSLSGKTIEFHSFKDLSSHLTPETLVVLDIDDTLLIPKQMLGCDEWFLYRMNQRKESGFSYGDALEKTLAEWEAVRHLTEMEIVEPETEAIIKSLQDQGYCVFGLTTQGLALATRTIQQLKELKIDLTRTAPSSEDIYFPIKQQGVLYRKGVLFTSGTPKGEALFQLCKLIDRSISRIVFVNDKSTHIAEIERVAIVQNVDFLGLRYSHSDARKAAFRPEIAELQFHQSNFGKILSDEEAIKIYK